MHSVVLKQKPGQSSVQLLGSGCIQSIECIPCSQFGCSTCDVAEFSTEDSHHLHYEHISRANAVKEKEHGEGGVYHIERLYDQVKADSDLFKSDDE